ncbi:MAG: transcriptional repressor [Phycisphaerae bacterium]|nr:transcriptional repressor [Phycisphaerae bacterium]
MHNAYTDSDLRAAEGLFREYLHGRGLRYTPERRTVLHGVMENHSHFEAEQLLLDLRAGGQRVAKATIYRTLPLLVGCGIIKPVQFGDNQVRYEHTYGEKPHDHLVCRRCRRVIEFDSSAVADLAAAVARRHHFEISSHRFQILGLCSKCVEASRQEQADDNGR